MAPACLACRPACLLSPYPTSSHWCDCCLSLSVWNPGRSSQCSPPISLPTAAAHPPAGARPHAAACPGGGAGRLRCPGCAAACPGPLCFLPAAGHHRGPAGPEAPAGSRLNQSIAVWKGLDLVEGCWRPAPGSQAGACTTSACTTSSGALRECAAGSDVGKGGLSRDGSRIGGGRLRCWQWWCGGLVV